MTGGKEKGDEKKERERRRERKWKGVCLGCWGLLGDRRPQAMY